MKVLLAAVALSALLAASLQGSASSELPDLVEVPVRFDMASLDVIPYVASVRASCGIVASGEDLVLLNDAAVRTTVEARPGPCSIVLSLAGTDIGLPILNTTPLGRNVFFIPGVATVSLGFVDVSIDLQTALRGTIQVDPPGGATLDPSNLTWPSWGSARVVVDAVDGEGSVLETGLRTSFEYAISMGLTVYALSLPIYHVDLAQLGVYPGSDRLATSLLVDLKPPAVSMLSPVDVSSDGATFRWSGPIPADADCLEVWLSEPDLTVSYPIDDPTTSEFRARLRPGTSYEAWIVVVDRAGQSRPSNVIAFESPTGPSAGVEPSGIPSLPWALLAVGVVVAVVVAAGLRTRKAN
jgi:hypothetical protein